MEARRIGDLAQACGMTPRMLRYRERLGLLPARTTDNRHRRFGPASAAAVRGAVALEDRYDLTPAQLAAAMRMLTDPTFRDAVRTAAEDLGRIPRRPAPADVDRERALHWLGRSGVLGPDVPK